MPKGSMSDFEFKQTRTLGQQLSYRDDIFKKLAGSDKDLSDSIAVLEYFKQEGLLSEEIDFIIGLLDILRKSAFATSDKTNEITKLSLMLPKGEEGFSGKADED